MVSEFGSDLRYTQHARARMALRAISEDEVATVVNEPEATEMTADVIRYHRVVDGRPLRVIVKRDVSPRLVITAMVIENE